MWGAWEMTGSHDATHYLCVPWACGWRHRAEDMAALMTLEATMSWRGPVDSAAHHLNHKLEAVGPAGVDNYTRHHDWLPPLL